MDVEVFFYYGGLRVKTCLVGLVKVVETSLGDVACESWVVQGVTGL